MAVQITKEFCRLGKYLPDIIVKTVFGGASINNNINSLKGGCDILVGTPGRIADLVQRKIINVSKVKYFVVDECDLQFQTMSIYLIVYLNWQVVEEIFIMFLSIPLMINK